MVRCPFDSDILQYRAIHLHCFRIDVRWSASGQLEAAGQTLSVDGDNVFCVRIGRNARPAISQQVGSDLGDADVSECIVLAGYLDIT